MNMFVNLKLTQKLLLLLFVVLAGFSLVGFSYYRMSHAEEKAALDAFQASEFGTLVDQIEIGVLKSRRFEKDFRIHKKMEYLEQYESTIADVIKAAKALRTTTDGEGGEVLGKVMTVLDGYREDVYMAAEARVAVGLDRFSGLLGDLQLAAQNLEKGVAGLGDLKLQTSSLQIQKYANGYVNSSDYEYVDQFQNERKRFMSLISSANVSNAKKEQLRELMDSYHSTFMQLYGFIAEMDAAFNKVSMTVDKLNPLITRLLDIKRQRQADIWQGINIARTASSRQFMVSLSVGALVVAILILIYIRNFVGTVKRIEDTVISVSNGDYEARTDLNTNDEIGLLSQALDKLLDDRVTNLMKAEEERERLNDSVISLLEAVSQLSQRDLTIKVPVTEDVTGPVADALNLLTAETARVLYRVNMISEHVSSSSEKVKVQSDEVMRIANSELEEVEHMVDELANAIDTMNMITNLAQSANAATDSAMETTETALKSVTETVDGIQAIREVIRETEKRIKRLGERSQEIGGTVDLINNIAERTHILALNASMHAASAGEAGRGFGVVADEVQRLAENARDATAQISTLVHNIQVETSDTVNTMNKVITQVVEGTQLAEQAGVRMNETKDITTQLISAIQQIAASSKEQVEVNKRLRQKTEQVLTITRDTTEQLRDQSSLTENLLKLSKQLLSTVRVFKLPSLKKAA